MTRPPHAYELTFVTPHLAVGHAPMTREQMDSLKAQGIGAILNLCAEFCDLHEIESKAGFEVYYLPIPDEQAPPLAELEKALAWIDEAVYLGRKVLIHCRHGIGRTGTVLNAYLLRRGMGHSLSARILKPLRSKPTNFDQWWTIRKYGRASGRLTIREPTLESKHLVDLGPFFYDYEGLCALAEEYAPEGVRCGREHVRCCATPVSLTFIEAVYISHARNVTMASQMRLTVIDRAVEAARREREAAAREKPTAEEGEFCLSDVGAVCPLVEDGKCLLFEYRPLQCRTFEIAAEAKATLWETLGPAVETLSRQAYFAFTSELDEEPPRFGLPDVVSGRYVQTFFHRLLKKSPPPAPGRTKRSPG
ncbi:phosphatase [Desulfovibrio sulfodismutans]|uniref:Phosphatase n=1 Tax=Desulfolutivibrio sulfodismutans TaxID=63561 RepID=A0A7K3NLG3_9BACT|nr:dual specificity protein phosphatase family protein [Desulfolutivibrio sulfodismutans]NDY57034.1 phosphatase [Desulfolutivibrio sulfodismutans]QLA12709.1 phosphatase [Desulfolutivibrio sulfodismutans DSM 3696]